MRRILLLLLFISGTVSADAIYFGYNHSGPDDFEDVKTILVGFEKASEYGLIGLQLTYGILDEELNDFDYADTHCA